jgi:predicted glycosyltransferase involved in capsule biosynthesis
MNRLSFLEKTLLYNLKLIYQLKEKYNIELILINYDSKDEMDIFLNKNVFNMFIDKKYLIYKRIYDKEFFHRSNAKNIAHLTATGDILCNLDVDCYLSEELIKETYDTFIEYGLNIIIHGVINYNFGYICLSKYNFNLIEGYDENLYYYGLEDYDILIRLCIKTNCKIKHLKQNYLNLLIDHNDSLRMTNHYNKYFTSFINAIIVNYNLNNNITNPNNGIFGIENNNFKFKELFDYHFFTKYILNDDYILNICKENYNNKKIWLDEKILSNFDIFLKKYTIK